jgi:hypothetical protein
MSTSPRAAPRAPKRRADARPAAAAAPEPAPAALYVPPNVKGNANGHAVDGTTFFPGMTPDEVKAFFADCVKKERKAAYLTAELAKRVDLLIKIRAVVNTLKNGFDKLSPLSATEVMSLIIPKDGWQSCHYEELINLVTGILAARLNHLNEWLSIEGNSLPADISAAIEARKVAEEEASAANERNRALEAEAAAKAQEQMIAAAAAMAADAAAAAFTEGQQHGYAQATLNAAILCSMALPVPPV